MSFALDGVRVLDLARFQAGPRGGMRLSDHKIDDAVAGEMSVPGVTVKLSRTPGRVGPIPTPGQHTDEVLRDLLGLDAAVIDALRRDRAVA